jgi:hypothetical protein
MTSITITATSTAKK